MMAAFPASQAELGSARCAPQQQALDEPQVRQLLALLDGWTIENGRLVKAFGFKNYFRTLAFVNAIAYVVHAQDHHPELTVEYSRCTVRYHTHSVNGGKGGLSINDFVCAARIDNVFEQAAS